MAHAVELSCPFAMLTVARHSDAESIAADVKAVAGGDREAFTRVYAAWADGPGRIAQASAAARR